MAYVGFEQVVVTNNVRDVNNFTVPGAATQVELQADTAHIRYTMDGSTNPTQSSGMLLLITAEPKLFGIADLRNIKFINDSGSPLLNVHYLGKVV